MKSLATIPADLAQKFKRFFGCYPTLYWDILIGFDLIAFCDARVQRDVGESAHQAVKRIHGYEAIDVIERLLAL